MEPDTITCMECSGTAHRVTHPPPDAGFEPGDIVAYACEDCGHRIDLVFVDDDEAGQD